MKRSLGIVFLVGVVFLSAAGSGSSPLTYLFYVLVFAAVGSYLWAWLGLRWLDVQVDRGTLRVQAGQPVEEQITVRNRSWLRKPLLEVMDLTDMPEHHTGMALSLPARGFRSWRALTSPRRRGVFRLGPLRIAAGDPFGLFRLEKRYAGT